MIMLVFFHPVTLTILSLVICFLIFYVIMPLKGIHSYKKKGVETYFFPILGIIQYWEEATKVKGDSMAQSKNPNKENLDAKYMLSNFKGKPVIFLKDPQYTKEFLLKPHLYKKSDELEALKYLAGSGTVLSEGETWKRHRRVVSNSFNYEFLKVNIPVLQDTAKEFFEKLTPGDYVNYPVISKIQEITGEIVGRIFFGENLNMYTFEGKPLTLALADIVTELSVLSFTPMVSLFGAKILKLPFVPRYARLMSRMKGFRDICFRIVSDRKNFLQDQQTNDLLGSLLATQKSDDPEKRFTDEEIVDEFITFFIAGMDTTGHSVGMALYNLTQHPEYLQELKEERNLTYNTETKVTAETLQKMDKLHSFLKETLRFHTPAPFLFFRDALVDHKLCDLDIKKGDILVPDFLASAFDEKNFEEPQ